MAVLTTNENLQITGTFNSIGEDGTLLMTGCTVVSANPASPATSAVIAPGSSANPVARSYADRLTPGTVRIPLNKIRSVV